MVSEMKKAINIQRGAVWKLLVTCVCLVSAVGVLKISGDLQRTKYINTGKMPECPDYVSCRGTVLNPYDSEKELPWIEIFSKDEDNKIPYKLNNNMYHEVVEWMPPVFAEAESVGSYCMLETKDYISLRYDYYIKETGETVEICATADTATGETLKLEDLVDVNRKLASAILHKHILQCDFPEETQDGYVDIRQKWRDVNVEKLLERLQACSEAFRADNYHEKPTFYLRPGRLYLCNVVPGESDMYVPLEAIQEHLKRTQGW